MSAMQDSEAEQRWEQLAPVLDEAIAALSGTEQELILLRFFFFIKAADIGVHLSISEDAAQKRVTRSIESLRNVLEQRGFKSSATVLGMLISANAVESAPSVLSTAVCAHAIAGGVGLKAGLFGAGLFAMSAGQKLLFGIIVTLAMGLAGFEVTRQSKLRRNLDAQATRHEGDMAKMKAERDAAMQEVTPGALSCLAMLPSDIGDNSLPEGERRRKLADWIVDRQV